MSRAVVSRELVWFERLSSGRCRVLPNRHCVPLEPTEGRTPVVLILRSLAYYYGPSLYREQLQKWLQDTGVTATDSVAIGQWLSVKIEWEGHEASRIHQAFTWMWRGIGFRLAHRLKLLPISS
jgi:hypothetical protein